MVDTQGTTYLIYAGQSITLTAKAVNGNQGTITGSQKYTGILRAVMLNDPSHKTLLDAHSSVYPTAVAQDYSISGTSANVVFTWTTQGSGDLLMLTWPHHRAVLQNPNTPATTALRYLTTKVSCEI